MDDQDLLRSYCETRSEEAFSELANRHIDLIYSVALRQTGMDEHLAQDVCQEVLCALAKKARSLLSHHSLAAWLYRCTRYAAVNTVRTEARRRIREENAMREEIEPTKINGPETDWEKLRPWLDEAISSLSDKDRSAISLRFFENNNYAAIAKRLGLTENAARMRVARSLEKLKRLATKRGLATTGAALSAALSGQATTAAPSGLAITLSQNAILAASGSLSWLSLNTVLNSLNTSKAVATIAILVAALSVGSAYHKTKQLHSLEQEFAELQTREQPLDTHIIEHSSPTAESKALLATHADQAPPAEPITLELLQARLAEADEYNSRGQYAEALKLYLWCNDNGDMNTFKKFVNSREEIITKLFELGKTYPQATVELRSRRDTSEQKLRSGSLDIEDFALFVTTNRLLGEEDRSIALFDSTDSSSVQNKILKQALIQELAEAQRYKDILTPQFVGMSLGSFDSGINRSSPANASEQRTPKQEKRLRETIQRASINIEIIAGSGDIENATELAARVLQQDSSPETISMLTKRLDRVGRTDIIEVLTEQLQSND